MVSCTVISRYISVFITLRIHINVTVNVGSELQKWFHNFRSNWGIAPTIMALCMLFLTVKFCQKKSEELIESGRAYILYTL